MRLGLYHNISRHQLLIALRADTHTNTHTHTNTYRHLHRNNFKKPGICLAGLKIILPLWLLARQLICNGCTQLYVTCVRNYIIKCQIVQNFGGFKLWQINRFMGFGEENVGKFTIANISYFSEPGIWLGKTSANGIRLAKFAKVFPHQNFALYCIKNIT